MINENLGLKKRKYLLAFVSITVLNIMLVVFLWTTSLGQKLEKIIKNQQPIVAEVVTQENNPLRLTVINVDNSNSSSQIVNYTVENISNRPVKGYVILGSIKNTGRISTNFFPVKSFQPQKNSQMELSVEHEVVSSSDVLSLSVDYVEFEDGSWWGKDTQEQSDYIAGGRAGIKSAIDELENFVIRKDTASLTNILEKELVDIEISLPNSNESEKWQKGFKKGYKGVMYFLKGQGEKMADNIPKKLVEIKKANQSERRQRQ